MKGMAQMARIVLFLVAIGIIFGTIAAAQPIKAPTVITTPGVYELEADARGITDIYGIKVECSDVVINGAGHFLGGEQREKSAGIYVNQYGGSITNVTVKNVILENWATGIDYKYVKGDSGDSNLITGCDIVNSDIGIHVEYSDYIKTIDNQIRECSSGIVVEGLSTYADVSKNIIKSAGLGVGITNSMHTTLNENNINTCSIYGVEVVDSEYTTITKNGISDNKYAAVRLENSKHSVLTGNNLSKTETGPVLIIGNEVRDAVITDNYFSSFENVKVDDVSSEISWNSTQIPGLNILGGPYLGGNYWGSAQGSKGFSDTASDQDGFGIADDVYHINDYNIDYLPLTHTTATKAPEEQQGHSTANVTTASEDEDGNGTTTGSIVESAQPNLSESKSKTPVQSVTTDNNTIPPVVTSVTVQTQVSPSNVTPSPTSVANISQSNESILNRSITNAYSSESPDSGLPSAIEPAQTTETGTDAMIPDLRLNTSLGTTSESGAGAQNNQTLPVAVGYILFTATEPGSRIILTTMTGSEVKLDAMDGKNLSVPVPIGGLVYTSYRAEKDGFAVIAGNISPYPASGETLTIPVTLVRNTDTTLVTNQSQQTQNLTTTQPASVLPGNITVKQIQAPPLSPLHNASVNISPPVGVSGSTEKSTSQPVVIANGIGITQSPSKEASHLIRASAGPGGAIFPDGTIPVQSGGSLAFMINADQGKKIAYLIIDGIKTSPMSEYRFINVTSDHTIVSGFT